VPHRESVQVEERHIDLAAVHTDLVVVHIDLVETADRIGLARVVDHIVLDLVEVFDHIALVDLVAHIELLGHIETVDPADHIGIVALVVDRIEIVDLDLVGRIETVVLVVGRREKPGQVVQVQQEVDRILPALDLGIDHILPLPIVDHKDLN